MQEDNLEIDLAESPQDSSESPAAQPFEQFRLHSKWRDGPLGKQTATLDRTQGDICKQVWDILLLVCPSVLSLELPTLPSRGLMMVVNRAP